jgi:uncharacterized membrane protein YfcA
MTATPSRRSNLNSANGLILQTSHILLLVPIGVVAGYLNVMAGGGSLLTVPALIFMGVPGHIANGTNRIAILAQNITAVSAFYKRGFHDFKLGLSLAACAVPGGILGAWLGVQLQGVWFNRILAVVMVLVMLMMAGSKPAKNTASENSSPTRLLPGHVLMFFAGIYGGVIQIGVGFILMSILYRVMGIDLVRVNMYKVLIVLCYTIAALAVFASQLELVWIAGIALAIGNSIGGWLGAHWSISKGESAIRRVLNVVLVVLIIKLLFFSEI